MAGAKEASDVGRGRDCPDPALTSQNLGDHLAALMEINNKKLQGPAHLGPRASLNAWKALGSDNVLLSALQRGIKAPLRQVPLPQHRPCSQQEIQDLLPTIQEYIDSGAIKELAAAEAANTHYWVPIFPRPKKDDCKVRVITDLRGLNACCPAQRHRAETWANVLQQVSQEDNKWGLTIDLKSYFHHLEVHQKTARWMRFRLGARAFQVIGMPFGWNLSPWWAQKLAKPVRAWMASQGWSFAWWVDDVLVLGPTQEETEQRAAALVRLLTSLGLKVNCDKSMKRAAQQFNYVGQQFNLVTKEISPIPSKWDLGRRLTKHQCKGQRCQPKNLAGLAGTLLDLNKGSLTLQGLPQQLMQFAGSLASKNAKLCKLPKNSPKAWGQTIEKPKALRELLQRCWTAMQEPMPRVYSPTSDADYRLRTDASDIGWGAQLCALKNGVWSEIATCSQHWTRDQQRLHITHREALASALAVDLVLDRISPGSRLEVQSDAMSTAIAWNKGSKVPAINLPISAQRLALAAKKVCVFSSFLPGHLNKRADWLSRNIDALNYRLHPRVFHKVCKLFNFKPEVDLFASSLNAQLPAYCSWRADRKSLGNAWALTWDRPAWANPPWQLIQRVLNKVVRDHSTLLVCLPVWRSAPWWGLLTQLQASPLYVLQGRLYSDPAGRPLPAPRWRTLFTVLRG